MSAPVLGQLLTHSEYSEYTVLYTFDVSKTHKVWKDGTMRLFKINKKVVLTDDSGIMAFEGFWKEYEEFAQDQTIKFENIWITIDSPVSVFERNVLGQLCQSELNPFCSPSEVRQLTRPTGVKARPTVTPKRAAGRRRVIGLRRSHGGFKSPLVTPKGGKENLRTPVSLSGSGPGSGPGSGSGSSRPVSVQAPLSVPTSSTVSNHLETPSKEPHREKLQRALPLPTPSTTVTGEEEANPKDTIEVYDSDSQDDELSELDESNVSLQELSAKKSVFRKLELNEGLEDEVVTETWGSTQNPASSHGRVGTAQMLEVSKKLLQG